MPQAARVAQLGHLGQQWGQTERPQRARQRQSSGDREGGWLGRGGGWAAWCVGSESQPQLCLRKKPSPGWPRRGGGPLRAHGARDPGQCGTGGPHLLGICVVCTVAGGQADHELQFVTVAVPAGSGPRSYGPMPDRGQGSSDPLKALEPGRLGGGHRGSPGFTPHSRPCPSWKIILPGLQASWPYKAVCGHLLEELQSPHPAPHGNKGLARPQGPGGGGGLQDLCPSREEGRALPGLGLGSLPLCWGAPTRCFLPPGLGSGAGRWRGWGRGTGGDTQRHVGDHHMCSPHFWDQKAWTPTSQHSKVLGGAGMGPPPREVHGAGVLRAACGWPRPLPSQQKTPDGLFGGRRRRPEAGR